MSSWGRRGSQAARPAAEPSFGGSMWVGGVCAWIIGLGLGGLAVEVSPIDSGRTAMVWLGLSLASAWTLGRVGWGRPFAWRRTHARSTGPAPRRLGRGAWNNAPWLTPIARNARLVAAAARAVLDSRRGSNATRLQTKLAPPTWARFGALAMLGVAWMALDDWAWRTGPWTRLASSSDAALISVQGVIDSPVRIVSSQRGALGRFSYASPSTQAELRVEAARTVSGQWRPAPGTLLLRVDRAAPMLQEGMRIATTGWFRGFSRPSNPGEFDYAAWWRARGVAGRLTIQSESNVALLTPDARSRPAVWREALRQRAHTALHLGLENPAQPGPAFSVDASRAAGPPSAVGVGFDSSAVGRPDLRAIPDGAGRRDAAPDDRALDAARRELAFNDAVKRHALLDAMLLGRRSPELEPVYESFRRTGLAHLLSISGAHLGILMGLAFLVLRLLLPSPPKVAALLLALLALYLLLAPPRVPILRAGVMVACFCLGGWWGLRRPPLDWLALAAVIVLLFRPRDLFEPGFQLSFGVVTAILLVLPAWRQTLLQLTGGGEVDLGPATLLWRAALEAALVAVVAFAASLPLLAQHFGVISPWSPLLSLLALPVVTAMLAVGYVKMLLGMIAPGIFSVLAGPLRWLTQALLELVEEAEGWFAAAIDVTPPPGWAWVLGCWLVAAALIARPRRPSWNVLAAAIVCAVWLFLAAPPFETRSHPGPSPPAETVSPTNAASAPPPTNEPESFVAATRPPDLDRRAKTRAPRPVRATLHVFAVGDGTCMLLRTEGLNFMFDCGSFHWLDVGERSIGPAVRSLGVRRIHVLAVSHADLDHFVGAPDLADAVPIDRVWVPPQLLQHARRRPGGATAALTRQLAQRRVTIETVRRGQTFTLDRRGDPAGPVLRVLWPVPETDVQPANDHSLVLAVELGQRRLLFCGDIQASAMQQLIRLEPELRADVVELPHHGAPDEGTLPWLRHLQPALVLQSSARWRLDPDQDPWLTWFARRAVQRLTTARHGALRLEFAPDGAVRWRGWLRGRGSLDPPPIRRR